MQKFFSRTILTLVEVIIPGLVLNKMEKVAQDHDSKNKILIYFHSILLNSEHDAKQKYVISLKKLLETVMTETIQIFIEGNRMIRG